MNDSESSPRGACGVCPIALLPPGAWQKLARQPFRKRHPVIWWLLVLLILMLIGISIWKIAGESGESGADRLALISVNGPILDPAATLAWIRKLEFNPVVKGALLRVDSPGGGAAASQEIYDALLRLGKKIPIVVSMGATAASGGLMVSMAGERVFANPSTVTGSIGVRMDIPQLQGLMGKLGIGQETLVTAPYKDAASYMHPMTPEDRAYLEGVIMDMHRQFVAIVASGRHMEPDKAQRLANGKIYTGQQALELGLVDEMGGQQAAHEWLARKTGVPLARKLLERPSERGKVLDKLLGLGKMLGLNIEDWLRVSGLNQPAVYY